MAATSVSTAVGFPGVPEFLRNADEHRRLMARMMNRMNLAKFNCTVDVTLNANTGSTLIADSRIGYGSAVAPLMAMTQSGALAMVATVGIWCDQPKTSVGSTSGSIVVHHASSGATDQTIRFGIFG